MSEPQSQKLILAQPLIVRIFHWLFAFTLTLMVLTGLYIHEPAFVDLPLNLVRETHLYMGFLLALNFFVIIYYYLFTGLHHTVIFDLQDIKHLPGFSKYVLFIDEKHPFYGRYNPGQKLIYSYWFLLFMLALVTGVALLYHDSIQWFFRLVGGLQRVRLYHFLIAIAMLLPVPVHIYLVLTEDPAKLQAMFTGYIKKS